MTVLLLIVPQPWPGACPEQVLNRDMDVYVSWISSNFYLDQNCIDLLLKLQIPSGIDTTLRDSKTKFWGAVQYDSDISTQAGALRIL